MAKRILLIDDSPSMRNLIVLSLSEIGYEVEEAQNGREGLDRIERQNNFDLVICDIGMPIMNGIEFIRELNQSYAENAPPVVVLTSRAESEVMDECREVGASGFIVKPFHFDQLIKYLESFFENMDSERSG